MQATAAAISMLQTLTGVEDMQGAIVLWPFVTLKVSE